MTEGDGERILRTVLGDSNDVRSSRVEFRRAAVRAEILEAAWGIVREHGLSGLSLRDLAARVGMRAASLYSYFPSKYAIYDAMFRQGYEEFIAAAAPAYDVRSGADVRHTAMAGAYAYFDFCTSDPIRHQLLFQRTIPGFTPSDDSYAVAVDAYDRTIGRFRDVAAADDADLDLWTAVITGLVDQQLANDPGGTRWRNLLERAVDALLADLQRRQACLNASTNRRAPRSDP